MPSILDPVIIGQKVQLRNRIGMAALTRNRNIDNYKPGPAAVRHYAERAEHGSGLIVSEGIFVDWTGSTWAYPPFMINDEHAEAWRKVVDAVHEKGGTIYMQAWHAGRCQSDDLPMMKEKGLPVLAPSAIKAEGGKFRNLAGIPGYTENVTAIENPADVLEQFKRAGRLAKKAGFDGIEILGQGGYLIHEFLNSRANVRTDAYGGSVENRCRFPLEVVDALGEIYNGCEHLSFKMCPVDFYNDSVTTFEESKETYSYLIKELVKRKVGIITISRRGTEIGASAGNLTGVVTRPEGFPLPVDYDPVLDFGPLIKYPGSPTLLMANHEYTPEEGDRLIKEGKIDMVSFGALFITNPDLVERVRQGVPLAENDRGEVVHYGPYKTPDEGYNDWPRATIVGAVRA